MHITLYKRTGDIVPLGEHKGSLVIGPSPDGMLTIKGQTTDGRESWLLTSPNIARIEVTR